MSNRSRRRVLVGVMGYSDKPYDHVLAESQLRGAFDQLQFAYPNRQVVIVSGHTDQGVPGQAYHLAKEYGFGTVGLTARRAHALKPDGTPKYQLFPVDTIITVGTEEDPWGVESETFVEYCTRFICLGEGPQSLREAQLAEDDGKDVQRFELPILAA